MQYQEDSLSSLSKVLQAVNKGIINQGKVFTKTTYKNVRPFFSGTLSP
jgi:hypothetical protein